MLRCAVLTLTLAAVALPAQAQLQRSFPAGALRGELQVVQPPEVLVNGKPGRLAPGARIHAVDNLTLVSGAIVGRKTVVNYTLDEQGQLRLVWVLSAGEAARQPWPMTREQATTWRFDAAAQTWSRP
jgi:hypothetical protein